MRHIKDNSCGRRCRRRHRLSRHAPSIFPAPARRFPYPIYAKWADAYKKETGNGLNYQSIGSGGGIKQIRPRPSPSAPPTCR